MLVCNCMDVEYQEILDAVKEFGTDLDTIKEETGAGSNCECCLEEDCDMVDLPLPLAIKKAQEELK